MKLKYEFEIVDMGDEVCAVPVRDNADEFHGVLTLNDVAAKMLEYIAQYDTPEQVHARLCDDYPDEDRREVGQKFCDFLCRRDVGVVGIDGPQVHQRRHGDVKGTVGLLGEILRILYQL